MKKKGNRMVKKEQARAEPGLCRNGIRTALDRSAEEMKAMADTMKAAIILTAVITILMLVRRRIR